MAPAPWDVASEEEQLFVLITGANRYDGIGLGIGQRLIDEFLLQRSLTSHLIVITTTRSVSKSRETVRALRSHLKRTAHSSQALRAKAGAGPWYDPEHTIRRVHVLSIELDLCKLPGLVQAADRLVNGTISSPCDTGEFSSLVDVSIPRLDAIICNAGIGGWTGINWPLATINFLTTGWVQATTYPTFKDTTPGLLVDGVSGRETTAQAEADGGSDRLLGQVFCANVFGHYLLGHALLPLLGRPAGSAVPPGRIILESSVEAGMWDFLSLDDLQAVRSHGAYESTKRLTDVLSLTAELPAVRPLSASYFREDKASGRTPPRLYLTHPGVVVTTLFPLNFVMYYLYLFSMYVSRWIGSPWHPVTAYLGAAAPVFVALQSQSALDEAQAHRVKFGSASDRLGHSAIKKTEVEGWGWEGRVEERDALARDPAVGILRNMVGRKTGAPLLTRERLEDFEALGAKCWAEMEALRRRWERLLASNVDGESGRQTKKS